VSSKYKIKCPCGKEVHYDANKDLWLHSDGEPCEALASYTINITKIEKYDDPFQIVGKEPDVEDLIMFLKRLDKEKYPKIIIFLRTIAGLLIPLKIEKKDLLIELEAIILIRYFQDLLENAFDVKIRVAREVPEKQGEMIIQIDKMVKKLLRKKKKPIIKLIKLLSKLLEK